jgi:hypothetical protein
VDGGIGLREQARGSGVIGAARLLLRAAWRRHWRASLFLAVVAGLAAAVIGASFQAARRAETSLPEFVEHIRVYEDFTQGCPPGVDPATFTGEAELIEQCTNPRQAARFREVLERVPGVERAGVASTLVVGVLDPSAANHWGRLTLALAQGTPGAPPVWGHGIMVDGRLADPDAADELVMGDAAARAAGVHVGDTVRIAGWRQEDLDAAVDGTIAPQTRPVASKVVGIVRGLTDVQERGTGGLSDLMLPGDNGLYAMPGWTRAHASDFSGYGSGVLVRLRDGADGVAAYRRALRGDPEGWLNQSSTVIDTPLAPIRRVIDLERQALLVFAVIAIVAGVAFVGLTAVRQLRRESVEASRLLALGVTRRGLRAMNVVRALTIAVLACVVATVGTIALSPLGPLGLARELEYDLGVHVDGTVLAATVGAVLVVFALAGLATPVDTSAAERRVSARASALDPALWAVGPAAVVGMRVARVRAARAAAAVTAVAVAAVIAAAGVVGSFDHLVARPERYGAWWDVAVGQYSESDAVDEAVATLRADPLVVEAAGFDSQLDVATIDGERAPLLALRHYVGHHGPVMADGRPPANEREVALGRETADAVGKGIGDRVRLRAGTDDTLTMEVVGIVVVADAVAGDGGDAGQGAFVRPEVVRQVSTAGTQPQSIVVKVDPGHRGRGIESVRRAFPASIRAVAPQADLRNLERLRSVPWLIAALVGVLALATVVHALVTMLRRHRTTLAVLAVMGCTRGQRRSVALTATLLVVAAGVVVGVPFGLVGGSRLWHAVAEGLDVLVVSVPAWWSAILTTLAALGIAALVALVTSWRTARMTPSEQLRVE